MTKRPQTHAYDRAAIMRDAHKRYRDGRRLGMGWTFSRCLTTAWAAARIRRARDAPASMAAIAAAIEDHIARRIVPAPEIRKGRIYEKDRMGFCISRADNGRRMADERSAICRSHGAR